MGPAISDYRVVSLLNEGSQTCYCVKEKTTGRLYMWEAVDYSILTANGKDLLLGDIKKVLNLNHQHLIGSIDCIDHTVTGTLYLVKEYCGGSVLSLVKKLKSTKSFVDEQFIWKVIYQIARAAQAAYARGPPSLQIDLTQAGVHLDDEGNVKLNYLLMFREAEAERRSSRVADNTNSRDSSERRYKKCDTASLGCLIHSIASLQNSTLQAKKQKRLPPHYSKELQAIIDLMMSSDPDKRPSIEDILYHPSLMSQVVSCSLQHKVVNEPLNNPEANTVPCPKCKELEAKLTAFLKRESYAKEKEHDLKERERFLAQKEKHICILEQLAKEKLSRAEVYLSQAKKGRKVEPPDDLDSSSYSADPGDTSVLPTTAKLDPTRIVRPASLAPSISSRRSVRFESIPELDEPLMSENQKKKTWLMNKRSLYKASQSMKKSQGDSMKDKENLEPQLQSSKGSNLSIMHSTKKSHDGFLETFFR